MATLKELRAQSETREQLTVADCFDALDRVQLTFEDALSFLHRAAASERRFIELQRRMGRCRFPPSIRRRPSTSPQVLDSFSGCSLVALKSIPSPSSICESDATTPFGRR